MIEIAQNYTIQTYNGHCYALKTGLEYMTFDVPMTLAVKNVVSGSFERCLVSQKLGKKTDALFGRVSLEKIGFGIYYETTPVGSLF